MSGEEHVAMNDLEARLLIVVDTHRRVGDSIDDPQAWQFGCTVRVTSCRKTGVSLDTEPGSRRRPARM
jgi:hypothetical protein